MRRTASVLAAVTATLAVAGCGVQESTGNAGGTADNYFHDLGSENYPAACQLLSTDLRQRLGDCPAALRERHRLAVGQRNELTTVSVRHVVYHGKDKAQVYPKDVTVYTTVTVRVRGTPTPRSSAVRSLAANFATDGQGLELAKVGDAWQISGGGV